MHQQNSIISILLMGGFLALSLVACDGKPTDPYPPTTTAGPIGTTTTTAGPTTTSSTTTSSTSTSSTTTTGRQGDTWSFVGVNNASAWTVRKNGVDQAPPTPVTVRVGDTVEWRTAPGAFPHSVIFNTQAAATGMLTFLPGGQVLGPAACFAGFTFGTNKCGVGFPPGTVLARATVKAPGSLRFTCEVHGPVSMLVDLNASP